MNTSPKKNIGLIASALAAAICLSGGAGSAPAVNVQSADAYQAQRGSDSKAVPAQVPASGVTQVQFSGGLPGPTIRQRPLTGLEIAAVRTAKRDFPTRRMGRSAYMPHAGAKQRAKAGLTK